MVFVALKDRSFLLAMKLCRKLNQLIERVSVVIWRMCEVHIFKVVVFAIFFSCVNEVLLISFNSTFVCSINQLINQSINLLAEPGTNKQRRGIVSGTTRHARLARSTYSSL